MVKNRILLVEDDRAIADAVTVNLGYSDYDYAVFHDGKEAADSLGKDHAFDLALLDVMLPGMDGFSLLEYMQRYGIPVIYLTAKSDSASEIKGLREGAEDYIIKPFDALTLLVRIEKVLARTGKQVKMLCFLDVEIDLERHIVAKAGAEVALKPLEFEVLVMLARHKNRTIPREKMLNEIWGVDFFGGTRTVDVQIANIRKKLGLADAIKTVPKYGYRLEDGT